MEDRAALDRALVGSVLGGDADAFGELVARYQRLVAGVAWRYGVAGDDIEDLVSEVFVKAFRNLHRYRGEHAFSTWLYRLAANHVIDHGRRTRHERRRAELPADARDPAASPDERFETRERADLLRGAMGELRPLHREPLFLVYVEGLTVDEAARVLGLPQGTLKTRLMRGRRQLRRILSKRHPEHFGEPS